MAESKKLRQVKRRVDEVVDEYGSYFTCLEFGHYRALQGSAEVFVDVVEEPDGMVLVRVHAPVTYEPQLTELNLLYLLQANATRPVATFSITEDHTVEVGQSLIGEYFHPTELELTVRAVALAADSLDELIAQRLEGKRSVDAKPWLKKRWPTKPPGK